MIHGRKRIVGALIGFATILSVSLVPMTPTHAEPDIDDVQARVDKLYHQAEQASERYNDARLKLKELKAELAVLRADQARQQAEVAEMQTAIDRTIVAQYEGQSLSATGQLVIADDPGQFLTELTTVDAFNEIQAQAVQDRAKAAEALAIRKEATAAHVKELAATKKALGKEKATIEEKHSEAEGLLDELKAEERAASVSRGGFSGRLPDVAASGRAGAAVEYALNQVGDSYVYGAAGPDAFDCSGLTMMAWAQAGVGLPHSSGAQQGSGSPVSSSSLQPGDLVFYYSPVSHVGIYIGGGKIVHAANPSTGVQITGVHSMPYSGAVRPG